MHVSPGARDVNELWTDSKVIPHSDTPKAVIDKSDFYSAISYVCRQLQISGDDTISHRKFSH